MRSSIHSSAPSNLVEWPRRAGQVVRRAAAVAASAGLMLGSTGATATDDRVTEMLERGHDAVAAELLRPRAEAGDIVAQERLGLMHWFGTRLFGPGDWNRDEARQWFERAAQGGSEIARLMLNSIQAQQTVLARERRRCGPGRNPAC